MCNNFLNSTFHDKAVFSTLFKLLAIASGSSYVVPPTISVIYYTLDGTTPTKNSIKYEFPIITKKDTIIKYIEIGYKNENNLCFTSF